MGQGCGPPHAPPPDTALPLPGAPKLRACSAWLSRGDLYSTQCGIPVRCHAVYSPPNPDQGVTEAGSARRTSGMSGESLSCSTPLIAGEPLGGGRHRAASGAQCIGTSHLVRDITNLTRGALVRLFLFILHSLSARAARSRAARAEVCD